MMSALDSVLNICRDDLFQPTEEEEIIAQAELAQLRAAADELQRIRELIEPLKGQSVYDAIDALLSDASSAEIYKIDMAEQARQLDEVREIITSCASLDRYVSDGGIEDARVWLAANPAPAHQP